MTKWQNTQTRQELHHITQHWCTPYRDTETFYRYVQLLHFFVLLVFLTLKSVSAPHISHFKYFPYFEEETFVKLSYILALWIPVLSASSCNAEFYFIMFYPVGLYSWVPQNQNQLLQPARARGPIRLRSQRHWVSTFLHFLLESHVVNLFFLDSFHPCFF